MSAASPKEPLPPSFVIRKHALAMLQNAPADPLAALEEKYRSKMLQQQHAAAIGSKETTKRSRRIWCFCLGGTGKWQTEFCWVLCRFVSLEGVKKIWHDLTKLPSGQRVDQVKSSELQEDLPMCTQDIYEEDAELDCDSPSCWF